MISYDIYTEWSNNTFCFCASLPWIQSPQSEHPIVPSLVMCLSQPHCLGKRKGVFGSFKLWNGEQSPTSSPDMIVGRFILSRKHVWLVGKKQKSSYTTDIYLKQELSTVALPPMTSLKSQLKCENCFYFYLGWLQSFLDALFPEDAMERPKQTFWQTQYYIWK